MTLADRTITALRATHDDLARLVPGLTDEQLTGPSGATEWSIAQVLSHLGSGAEIGLAAYRSALDGTPPPPPDFNPGVWDRWNAMTPTEQAAGFLESDAALVTTLEALTPEQRESTRVELGFLPAPLPLASVAGMRLNEAALHAWDVRVGLDPAATVDPASAAVLVEHFTGGLGFLLGFLGKADQLPGPAVVALEGAGASLVVGETVSLSTDAPEPTATFHGPAEAAVRLLGGRLGPDHTPDAVTVSGDVALDDLRRVFPGF